MPVRQSPRPVSAQGGKHITPARRPDETSLSSGYFLGYRTILELDPDEAQVSFVTGTGSLTLGAQDKPEDCAIIGVSLAAANSYFALEVGLSSVFGGDTETVLGSVSLRDDF